MADYLFGIAEQGNCPALFPAGVFGCGDQTIVVWDKSGHMDIADAFREMAGTGGMDSRKAFLDLSCMLFSALAEAEDWLIPTEALDLSKKHTGCDLKNKTVKFCLGGTDDVHPISGCCCGKDLAGAFSLLGDVFSDVFPGIPFPLQALEKKTLAENLGIKSIIKQLGLMQMR